MLFWSIFITIGCSFAVFVVLTTVLSFLENPTVTSLSPQKGTIWSIPFPALSICSVNRFSRQRMEAFARNISKQSGKPEIYWKEKIQLLSGFYDERIQDGDEYIEFEMELKRVIGTNYDAVKILKELAPTCEELIIACHWAGAPGNCSKLFSLVPTIAGYCCMFNRREQNTKSSSTFYPNGTGIHLALSMVLNSSTADYFFKSRSTNGFHMQIFEVSSFPDISTGEVRELTIPPGSDVNVELSIIRQIADEEIRRIPPAKRCCFFENENLGKEFLTYSQSECYTRCRIKSMQALCDCQPYYTPKWSLKENISVCSLLDLDCLSHFFITWRTYRPVELEGTSLLAQDALSCGACYPLCTFSHYYYKKQVTLLNKTYRSRFNRRFLSNFKMPNNSEDISLVKVYFPSQYVTRYNKKVLYNWYQILSNIGGVIGISIGCSIISGFEWIYFFTYRFYINLSKLHKIHTAN